MSPVSDAIPALPEHWLRGHLDYYIRGPFEFYERTWREFGDVAGVRLGPARFVQIVHPDDILRVLRGSNGRFEKGPGWDATRIILGKGLITVEPKNWLANRRALQPAFLRAYHERFAAVYAHTLEKQTMPRLIEISRRGETVPIYHEMVRLTMQNSMRTLFDVDIAARQETLIPLITSVFFYINQYNAIPLWKRKLGPYFKNTTHARFHRARAELYRFADELVRDRLAAHARGEDKREDEKNDLLTRLLFERDDETPRRNSTNYLRDELMTFLFAAHETTSLTLSWIWARLAQNPDIEAQLHEEVDRVLDGRVATVDDLPDMPFGRMIIEETLRLHPPVWSMPRRTTQPEEFGGYAVKKGQMLLLMPWLTHRHPEFWPDPERFDPQRFSPQNSAARHEGAYVAFGGGTRQCIGKRVAMIEVQLILCALAQSFKLRFAPGYEPNPLPAITLRISENLPMVLLPRA